MSDDSDALVFLPSDGEFPAEPGCWRLTDGVGVDGAYRTFEIDEPGSESDPSGRRSLTVLLE